MTAEQYSENLQELVSSADSVLATYDENIKSAGSKEIKQELTDKRDRIVSEFRDDLEELHNNFRGITEEYLGVEGEQGS